MNSSNFSKLIVVFAVLLGGCALSGPQRPPWSPEPDAAVIYLLHPKTVQFSSGTYQVEVNGVDLEYLRDNHYMRIVVEPGLQVVKANGTVLYLEAKAGQVFFMRGFFGEVTRLIDGPKQFAGARRASNPVDGVIKTRPLTKAQKAELAAREAGRLRLEESAAYTKLSKDTSRAIKNCPEPSASNFSAYYACQAKAYAASAVTCRKKASADYFVKQCEHYEGLAKQYRQQLFMSKQNDQLARCNNKAPKAGKNPGAEYMVAIHKSNLQTYRCQLLAFEEIIAGCDDDAPPEAKKRCADYEQQRLTRPISLATLKCGLTMWEELLSRGSPEGYTRTGLNNIVCNLRALDRTLPNCDRVDASKSATAASFCGIYRKEPARQREAAQNWLSHQCADQGGDPKECKFGRRLMKSAESSTATVRFDWNDVAKRTQAQAKANAAAALKAKTELTAAKKPEPQQPAVASTNTVAPVSSLPTKADQNDPCVITELARRPMPNPRGDVFFGGFRSTDLNNKMLGQLSSYFDASVVAPRSLRLASLQDLNATLQLDRLRDVAGCNDVTCSSEIAGMLGAGYFLTGAVNQVAGTWIATLRVVDTQSQRQIAKVGVEFEGAPFKNISKNGAVGAELQRCLKRSVQSLAGMIFEP